MSFQTSVNETTRVFLVCLGFILSLFIFQEGLLIKKHAVVDQKSQCSDVGAGKNCWIEPSYKRAVLVLIDSLRFDFVQPGINDGKSYHGSMPTLGNYVKNHRDNCRLFKFIADPPTTTMQRITGLVTGSVPTFIDASGNFAATEILEDNLLSQLVSLNRTTVLLGDDTWSIAMESFDVKDLDLVDTTITPKLFEELDYMNFSLLIAHFLGVDHCGHRYGPFHPKMRHKLNEMDSVIEKVIEKLDNDTILFVFGDHGQTESGDHGGDSALELETALFVYSKRPLPKSTAADYERVPQIDLLPTVSLLLDVPIPFSNLGVVIESLFEESKIEMATKLNSMQVIRYVSNYNIQNPTIQKSLKFAIKSYESQLGTESSLTELELIRELHRLIFKSINKFDLNLIYIGGVSLFECLLTLSVLITSNIQASLVVYIIFRTGLLFLQCATYFGGGGVREDSTLIYLALYSSISYNFVLIALKLINLKKTSLTYLVFAALTLLLCVSQFSNSFIIYGAMTGRFLLTSMIVLVGVQLLRQRWLLDRPKFTNRGIQLNQIRHISFVNLCVFAASLLILRLSVYFNRCREEQIGCSETLFSVPAGLIGLESEEEQPEIRPPKLVTVTDKYYLVGRRECAVSMN